MKDEHDIDAPAVPDTTLVQHRAPARVIREPAPRPTGRPPLLSRVRPDLGLSADVFECCGAKTIVIDSRPGEGTIRRRRKCPTCGDRFTTLELRLTE